MPSYDRDTARSCHRHGKDMNFTVKSEVSDRIRSDMLPILKYPCIIGYNSGRLHAEK